MSEFVPCRIAKLPAEETVAAAQTAIAVNPANSPPEGAELGPMPTEEGEAPRLYRLALLTSKYWGAKGVKLGVSFVDPAPPALRTKIISYLNRWNKSANIVFKASARGEVRIGLDPRDGHYSYLGTDILHIPAGTKTMNLALSLSDPESEFRRVVPHEGGHTCGFPHEHQRAEIVQRIDPEKAIAYFGRWQGWSPDEVRQQVLTALPGLRATPHADVLSAMCYSLPGEIMRDGQPVPGGTDIDAADYAFAALLYPKPRGRAVKKKTT